MSYGMAPEFDVQRMNYGLSGAHESAALNRIVSGYVSQARMLDVDQRIGGDYDLSVHPVGGKSQSEVYGAGHAQRLGSGVLGERLEMGATDVAVQLGLQPNIVVPNTDGLRIRVPNINIH